MEFRELLVNEVICSTSSGGNQVDGLPSARHTETVAERARVGPRTQVVLSMKKCF